MYRVHGGAVEVFLVHPGGPYWANKDDGSWSIPKGECEQTEDRLAAARREFQEETGFSCAGDFVELAPVKQRSGKTIYAWALSGDCDAAAARSNSFSMEWPPRSGKRAEFPEVDRAAWFPLDVAKQKIQAGQRALLDQLEAVVQRAGA